jgi:hypothetical protein
MLNYVTIRRLYPCYVLIFRYLSPHLYKRRGDSGGWAIMFFYDFSWESMGGMINFVVLTN